MTILDRWTITADQLTQIVDDNPSLRGMLFGYVAELKLHEILEAHGDVAHIGKSDDHDRSKKGDRHIHYKGEPRIIESKSLQSSMIKQDPDGTWRGKAQVDASDRREVVFPNGSKLTTTCLLPGEFDVLAINCYAFENKWRFVYALNEDLPRSSHRAYTEYQRQHLLATLVECTWPPRPPFTDDLFALLDRLD